MIAYCLRGADLDAGTAADTFAVVRGFCDIYVHFAGAAAFAAGNTFIFIHAQLQKGNAVEPCVKRAEGANPFAEGAVKQDAQDDDRKEHAGFPCEQGAERGADTAAGEGEGNCAFQDTLRTEIFAEEGVPHAEGIDHKGRQKKYHDDENQIFQIAQSMQPFCGKFPCRDFMEQLLQPAEGAEKAADKSSEQNADENQHACDVIGKLELGRADHCLHCPDGTRPCRTRAGIAIQPRHADLLGIAAENGSLKEIRQMDIGEECCEQLYFSAQVRKEIGFCFFLSQYQHTPDII